MATNCLSGCSASYTKLSIHNDIPKTVIPERRPVEIIVPLVAKKREKDRVRSA